MLYVYYGSDVGRAREEALKKLAKLQIENPEIVVNRLEVEDYEFGLLRNAVNNVALFSGPQVYCLNQPSTSPEYLNEVKELATALADSNNHFIINDGNLLVADKKPLQAAATEMTEYKQTKSFDYNPFKLADCLANHDKPGLWFELQEAQKNNLSAEEIIGILWWQLKILNLAKLTNSASEAGVKDFPYNKAKKALIKFKDGEVEALSQTIIALYHEGHAGKRDINLALEEWILNF